MTKCLFSATISTNLNADVWVIVKTCVCVPLCPIMIDCICYLTVIFQGFSNFSPALQIELDAKGKTITKLFHLKYFQLLSVEVNNIWIGKCVSVCAHLRQSYLIVKSIQFTWEWVVIIICDSFCIVDITALQEIILIVNEKIIHCV